MNSNIIMPMKFNRQLLVRIHTLIAAFFLPIGLLFLISGIFLTFDIKVGVREVKSRILVPAQRPSLSDAVSLVSAELDRQHLARPSGEPSLKDEKGGGWSMAWNGAATGLKLNVKETTGDLAIQDNGLLRRTEQLHKAKGALFFKIFATAWAIGLLTLFLSGTLMALQVKALKGMTLLALGLGFASFVVLALIS